MTTKSTRYLDAQGRIILPSHIRKALNLVPGSAVDVDMEDAYTIRIRPADLRCALCGVRLTENEGRTITVWSGEKHVCGLCESKILIEKTKEYLNG